jgi:hypothetical protein
MRKASTTIVAFAIIALIPASSNAQTAGTDQNFNTCRLATPAEVSSVIGVKADNGTFVRPTTGAQCNFRSPTSPYYSISIQLVNPGFVRELGDVPNNGSVKGVGDEAYWAGWGKSGSLYVRKGNRALRIGIGIPTPVNNTPPPGFIKFAKTVVSRL